MAAGILNGVVVSVQVRLVERGAHEGLGTRGPQPIRHFNRIERVQGDGRIAAEDNLLFLPIEFSLPNYLFPTFNELRPPFPGFLAPRVDVPVD